ncbi:MAG: efflux RND transporter periplasmic adaptor subunit [Geminicoccaceae bacterium]
MRRSLRSFPPLFIALAALGACDEPAVEAEAPPTPIAWAVVETASSGGFRSLPGTVRAIQRANMSFQVSGRVAEVAFEIGDHFEAGDVLARLEPDTYRLTVRERESEVAEAQARLAEAENDHSRQQQLYDRGWVSKAAFDFAISARDTAQSQVEMAQARLAIAEDGLGDTVIRAPYGGTVAARLIEPSQQVSAGETVLEVQGNSGGLEVLVSVPETLVDRLTLGSSHDVRFPSRPNLRLNGMIREIGSRATMGSAFPVTLRLEDAPPDLRAGITSEVLFALNPGDGDGETVIVPATAYLPIDDETTVSFVFDEATGTVSRREVTVRDLTGDRALISDGLEPGEIVAARGLPFLKDGQSVVRLGTGIARYNP